MGRAVSGWPTRNIRDKRPTFLCREEGRVMAANFSGIRVTACTSRDNIISCDNIHGLKHSMDVDASVSADSSGGFCTSSQLTRARANSTFASNDNAYAISNLATRRRTFVVNLGTNGSMAPSRNATIRACRCNTSVRPPCLKLNTIGGIRGSNGDV